MFSVFTPSVRGGEGISWCRKCELRHIETLHHFGAGNKMGWFFLPSWCLHQHSPYTAWARFAKPSGDQLYRASGFIEQKVLLYSLYRQNLELDYGLLNIKADCWSVCTEH